MKNQLKSKVIVILIIITCCILLLLFWWLFNMVDTPNPLDP
ncbi:hypothetical protein PALU110988_28130 [Paenibacillus lupini]|nr:putative phage infection (PIP) family protein YhgE [Paenibacillus lupini]